MRLAALHLLDSKLVDPAHDQVEVLKRCLQGEEVPIDIQGVRERVLRIGRVGQVVGDEKGADLCARWLISQLKVNLRPLWSPAAAALASLAQRFGDLVWRLLFEELQKMSVVETIGTSESQSSVEREQEPNGESGEDDGEDDGEGRAGVQAFGRSGVGAAWNLGRASCDLGPRSGAQERCDQEDEPDP